VDRIDPHTVAITIVSLGADNADHRPPNFDVLIITP